jgi:hypothetical protein
VATVVVNAALGLVQDDLDSRDEIVYAASKRPQKEISQSNVKEPVSDLKQQLYDMGECGGDKDKLDQAFELLENIESCNQRSPTTDPILNGRWDFAMDVVKVLASSRRKTLS